MKARCIDGFPPMYLKVLTVEAGNVDIGKEALKPPDRVVFWRSSIICQTTRDKLRICLHHFSRLPSVGLIGPDGKAAGNHTRPVAPETSQNGAVDDGALCL